jgi:hypothetical protein
MENGAMLPKINNKRAGWGETTMYAKWTSWWKIAFTAQDMRVRGNLEALTLQKKMLFVAWYDAGGISNLYFSNPNLESC